MNEMKKRQQNLLMEALKAQAIKAKADLAQADAVYRGAVAAYREYLRHEILGPLFYAKFGYEDSICVRVTESQDATWAGIYRFKSLPVPVEFDNDMRHWIPTERLSLNKDGTQKRYDRRVHNLNPDFLLSSAQIAEPPLRKSRSKKKAAMD